MTDIGARIYSLRTNAGLTSAQLAQALGVTEQTVSDWEGDVSEPSAQNIFSLYDIFGQKLFSDVGNIAGDKPNRPCMESIKEIYKIGRGPSSSHTIGPERACKRLKELYPNATGYKITLFGSLAKTGKGHGTDVVITETLKPAAVEIVFDNITQTAHPNTMRTVAFDGEKILGENEVRSIGGGDIVFDNEIAAEKKTVYQYRSFADISNYCKSRNISLWEYANENEDGLREYLGKVWKQMTQTVERGLHDEGILPGGLGVHKKAKQLFEAQHIDESPKSRENRLICAYAFAVSEQNASAQTIVTAPTCGAAGVLPAVLYYEQQKNDLSEEKIIRALATAGIIGNIIKTNASISGAECGCQAEIGSACAMAAAALGELFELSIDKIEYAAEIALEHHLGLTCDPVCGLVQIPCIERNAVAAIRAKDAVNLASLLWDTRKISFDNIVKTMAETGKDLLPSYRETSEGGLAKTYRGNIKINGVEK